MPNPTDESMIDGAPRSNGIHGMATVSEAAKVLDVSPRRVLQFIRDKRLKAQRVTPRLYLVDMEDVKRFKRMPRVVGNPAFRKSKKSG